MKAPLKNEQQIAQVFARAAKMREPEKWHLMLTLSYELGLRPIELAQLDTSHFRDGELRIRIGHTKGPGGRSIPYRPAIYDALMRYMGERRGRVFLNSKGQPMTNQGVTKAMMRLYREAGQLGSCYSGRRTLLTRLVEQDVNILVVQGIAGHKSSLTTQSYVGCTQEMMARALSSDAVSALLPPRS